VGSGIVHDSDPQAEWEECRLKGNFLQQPAPEFSLIETLLWQRDAGYWLLELHMERLLDSACYFDYPVDRDEVMQRLEETTATLESDAARVRLTVDRDGIVSIVTTTLPVSRMSLQLPEDDGSGKSGILPRVMLSPQRTDSASPFWYHKTTIRDLYDRERQRAVKDGFYEVLFCNERGELTEGAIFNLFIRSGGQWLTPPLSSGLLNGIFRRAFLAAHPGLVREAILTVEDLQQAEAIYLANSVRGLVRVRLH
jgi:para-aminobenzoate synthetase/4-amino-4-deoxychorismate lyase